MMHNSSVKRGAYEIADSRIQLTTVFSRLETSIFSEALYPLFSNISMIFSGIYSSGK